MKYLKLHLGCGTRYIPGFVHVDLVDLPHVDYKIDCKDLSIFKTESVDLIYACHLLEHFNRHEVENVLQEWYRVLIKGGILRISVPDFEKITLVYNKTKNVDLILGLVVGGQDYAYNFHNMIFDFDSLSNLLKKVNFTEVRRYDWRKTEHAHIDDYSQAYIPHLDKEKGILMSLNVEAIK